MRKKRSAVTSYFDSARERVALRRRLVAVLLVGQLLFANLSPPGYPLTFLPFPVLLWAAFRFSPRESILAVVVLMTMAVWGTTRGLGPFADLGPNEALLLLHVFLATIAVTSLLAAALVAERRRVEARLEAAQEAPVRLAAIVADSDDAIVSKTLDGRGPRPAHHAHHSRRSSTRGGRRARPYPSRRGGPAF